MFYEFGFYTLILVLVLEYCLITLRKLPKRIAVRDFYLNGEVQKIVIQESMNDSELRERHVESVKRLIDIEKRLSKSRQSENKPLDTLYSLKNQLLYINRNQEVMERELEAIHVENKQLLMENKKLTALLYGHTNPKREGE